MKFSILVLLSLLATQFTWAHPVIYKDGIMLGTANMSMYSDNEVNYSFHQQWSTGINHLRFTKDETNVEMGLLRLNHLLKRWNQDESQGNIYLISGIGVADSGFDQVSSKAAYLGGIETDWESRTLLASFKYTHFNSPDLLDIGMSKARIGFSPFEASFDKLQTWIMLQGMYIKGVDKNVIVTPMIRLFYNNVLWEMGSSIRGEWMFNFMVHI
jgi:hypothetical protein